MDNKEIVKIMKKSGGHCKESIEAIKKALTVKELSEVLFDFIKPCMANNFPNYKIMYNFREIGEPYGVYVDSQKGNYEARSQNVLYGYSDMILVVKPYDVVRIYLKDHSKVRLIIGENAIVTVYKLDKSSYKVIEGCEYSLNERVTIE